MSDIQIQSVLVPYTFSERCRAAAAHAILVAERLEAPLVLAHVVPYSGFEYASFEGGAYVGTAWPSEAAVRERLTEQASSLEMTPALRSRLRIEVTKGDPPQHIVELAKSLPSPLVVMATHGFGRFRRLVLGSVVNKVLHDIDVPVLTGAHLDDAEPTPPEAYRSIVCAIDLGDESLRVLRWAAWFAKLWGARVTVAHAVDWLAHSPLDEERFTPGLRDRLVDDARRKGEDLMAAAGIEGALLTELGAVEEVIPRAIERLGADLLIIGRTAEHGRLTALRESAYGLVRHSPRPVLSV